MAQENGKRTRTPVAFRLDADLARRLDRYVATAAAREQIRITRTDGLESLLALSLDLVQSLEADTDILPTAASVREVWAMALAALHEARREKDDGR